MEERKNQPMYLVTRSVRSEVAFISSKGDTGKKHSREELGFP